ncbi:MAG: hypothetical protein H6Q68_1094 [Firmicutes bacterium]|nr:hypothetical protein [Bacillota bacterium]
MVTIGILIFPQVEELDFAGSMLPLFVQGLFYWRRSGGLQGRKQLLIIWVFLSWNYIRYKLFLQKWLMMGRYCSRWGIPLVLA